MAPPAPCPQFCHKTDSKFFPGELMVKAGEQWEMALPGGVEMPIMGVIRVGGGAGAGDVGVE